MLSYLLFGLIVGAYGLAIPLKDESKEETNDCLDACFRSSSLLESAYDLSNFQDIAKHSDNFCTIHTTMKACVALCSEREKRLAVERGRAAEFFCAQRQPLLEKVGKCLVEKNSTNNVVEECADGCGLPLGHGPIRLDSSPQAMVNPSVFLDGIENTCKKEVCIIRCSADSLEKTCADAGLLFRDAARYQIQIGIIRMAAESSMTKPETSSETGAAPPSSRPEGLTQIRTVAESGSLGDFVNEFIKSLPHDCHFLYNTKDFDKAVDTVDVQALMAAAHAEEPPFTDSTSFGESADPSFDEPLGPPTPAKIVTPGVEAPTVSTATEEHEVKPAEMSHEPDVPIGAADMSGTTEAPSTDADFVEGPAETDEKIIDMVGHEVSTTEMPSSTESIGHDSEGEAKPEPESTEDTTVGQPEEGVEAINGGDETSNDLTGNNDQGTTEEATTSKPDEEEKKVIVVNDIDSGEHMKSSSTLHFIGSLLLIAASYIILY